MCVCVHCTRAYTYYVREEKKISFPPSLLLFSPLCEHQATRCVFISFDALPLQLLAIIMGGGGGWRTLENSSSFSLRCCDTTTTTPRPKYERERENNNNNNNQLTLFLLSVISRDSFFICFYNLGGVQQISLRQQEKEKRKRNKKNDPI